MTSDEDTVRWLADRLDCLLVEAAEEWMTSSPRTVARAEGALVVLRAVLAGDLTPIPDQLLADQETRP